MNTWIEQLNALAVPWLAALWRASWQGGVAIILVWMMCRAIPRLPAQAKSWLWRLAYVKLLLALLWATPINLPLLPAKANQPIVRMQIPEAAASVPAPMEMPPVPLPETKPVVSVTARAVAPPMATVAAIAAPVPLVRVWPTWTALLLVGWILGIASICARTGRDLFRARQLRRAARLASDSELLEARAELAREFRLGAEPDVLISAATSSPMLLGVLRPAVLLPTALAAGATPAHLRLMLAHEMAHLKRRDLWWVWLAVAGESGFFFHPLVWLARREWRLAQEIACDDAVVRLTRVPASSYGEMLVGVAALGVTPPPEPLLVTLGLTETKSMLVKRLNAMKMIQLNPTKSIALAAAGILAVGIISIIPWRLTAQEAVPGTSTVPATPGASATAASTLQPPPQDEPPVRPLQGRRGPAGGLAGGGGGIGGGGGAQFGGGFGGGGRSSFSADLAQSPAPNDVASAHFEATVYQVDVGNDQIADLNARALESAAGTPKDLNAALTPFGAVKVLYKVDQTVNLYGENINIGSSEPMVSGITMGPSGRRVNSLNYQHVGLMTRISAPPIDDPKNVASLKVRLNFQLSAILESGVEISEGVDAGQVQTVELSQNGTPKFGKPSVLLTIGTAGSGAKAHPVAFVVRYLFTQEKP